MLLFGVLQLVSNFGFYLLAQLGKGAWGAVMVPAFDWGFVALDAPAALGFRHLVQVHSQLHGLTIRPSRPCFTAANFSGMFVLDCRRAAGRLNSGVRRHWRVR